MSVLRNNRKISENEYERTFKELYRFTKESLIKVPKRKQKFLCDNIYLRMNSIFEDILKITEMYVITEEDKILLAKRAIKKLKGLEKPLLALWNIENIPEKKMTRWATLVDTEVSLLTRFVGKEDDVVVDMSNTITINWKQVKNTSFLSNMSQLHRVVHAKAEHIPKIYLNSDTSMIISIINDAWYNLLKANQRIPKTQKEYQNRRKLISEVISDLYSIQRPMVTFFNLMQYSENTIMEISNLINDELKMLIKLQKSDRERFSNLK